MQRVIITVFAAAIAVFPFSGTTEGSVLSGYDLLHTTGAFFDLPPLGPVQFAPVPLGTFDFGDGNGPVPVGNADAIVHRLLDTPNMTGIDTIPIEMVALSLRSVDPFNIGAGPENLLVDLLSAPGSMDINHDNMTFTSELNVNVQLVGENSGIMIPVPTKILTATDVPWSHDKPNPLAVMIDGINFMLNDLDTTQDFWIVGQAFHDDGGDGFHIVEVASVPEPSAIAIWGLFGVIGTTNWRRRRRKRAQFLS